MNRRPIAELIWMVRRCPAAQSHRNGARRCAGDGIAGFRRRFFPLGQNGNLMTTSHKIWTRVAIRFAFLNRQCVRKSFRADVRTFAWLFDNVKTEPGCGPFRAVRRRGCKVHRSARASFGSEPATHSNLCASVMNSFAPQVLRQEGRTRMNISLLFPDPVHIPEARKTPNADGARAART